MLLFPLLTKFNSHFVSVFELKRNITSYGLSQFLKSYLSYWSFYVSIEKTKLKLSLLDFLNVFVQYIKLMIFQNVFRFLHLKTHAIFIFYHVPLVT